jgi:integrase
MRVFTLEILPHWRGWRLSEVTKADVRRLLDGIVKRGAPILANRALATIKAFCNWAVSGDVIPGASPAASVRPPAPETARDRGPLSDEELGAVLRVSQGLKQYGAGVRLLALTCARRSEVFGMTWDEVDIGKRLWTLSALGMAALGVQPHVVEAVLNHRSGVIWGVASVYNRYSYAAERGTRSTFGRSTF